MRQPARTLKDNGTPETVFAVDESGQELWQRPAAEVASWYMRDSEAGKTPEFFSTWTSGVGEGDPVVIVGSSPSGGEEPKGIAGAAEGPFFHAYDLRTGDDLWDWGERQRPGRRPSQLRKSMASPSSPPQELMTQNP